MQFCRYCLQNSLQKIYTGLYFCQKCSRVPASLQPHQQKLCSLSIQFFTIQWYLNVVFICISLNMSEFTSLHVFKRLFIDVFGFFVYVVNCPFMSVSSFLLCFQSFDPQFQEFKKIHQRYQPFAYGIHCKYSPLLISFLFISFMLLFSYAK